MRTLDKINATTWEQHIEQLNALLDEIPINVRYLAELLWAIERNGSIELDGHAAPLHVDLAVNILNVPGAKEALLEALK